MEGHTNKVTAVAWSPQGDQIASGADDGTVRIWNATTGTLLRTLEGHTEWVHSVAWSPQGDRIAIGTHVGMVRIRDVQSENLVAIFLAFGGSGEWITYIPSGYFIGLPEVVERVLMGMQEGEKAYNNPGILPQPNPNPQKVREALAGKEPVQPSRPQPPAEPGCGTLPDPPSGVLPPPPTTKRS